MLYSDKTAYTNAAKSHTASMHDTRPHLLVSGGGAGLLGADEARAYPRRAGAKRQSHGKPSTVGDTTCVGKGVCMCVYVYPHDIRLDKTNNYHKWDMCTHEAQHAMYDFAKRVAQAGRFKAISSLQYLQPPHVLARPSVATFCPALHPRPAGKHAIFAK